MSYRLACESGDRIVGIGVFAGTLGVDTCDPAEPVSVIHVHGTDDTNLPLAGGVGPDSIAGVDFPVPRDGFDQIAGEQACPTPSTSTVGDVTIDRSEPCAGGVADGVRHDRVGEPCLAGWNAVADADVGARYAGYDATTRSSTFLLAHPRGDPTDRCDCVARVSCSAREQYPALPVSPCSSVDRASVS